MTKLIYMAGLMDGEGTIGIARADTKGRFRAPYISVTTTTPEIAEWLQSNFGGHVCKQKVYRDHHKPSWSWRLKNLDQLFNLLEGILPYMLEPDKIRRANLLLNEYKTVTVRNGKYTPEQMEKKLAFEANFLS